MDTLRYAIAQALERKQDTWEAKHRAYRQGRKEKPCFPGTKPNLAPLDPTGREFTARMLLFFGFNYGSENAMNAVEHIQRFGSMQVFNNSGDLIGKIKMERTQRWDVPVARMYRLAA